jgi:hypothetical protein
MVCNASCSRRISARSAASKSKARSGDPIRKSRHLSIKERSRSHRRVAKIWAALKTFGAYRVRPQLLWGEFPGNLRTAPTSTTYSHNARSVHLRMVSFAPACYRSEESEDRKGLIKS